MNYNYQNELAAVYESVINDVIDSCREMFADERVDETVLDDLKSAWRQRMIDSGALPAATPSRTAQQNAVYMPAVAQKGQPSLVAGQAGPGGSRSSSAQQQQQQQQQSQQQIAMANLQMGQQRISATHVLSPAALMATSAIRSQLKPMSDVSGMIAGQGILQQQPPGQGRNVISAVIVPVTKSTTDIKAPPAISRRVQLDGRYDGHGQASSSGAASGGAGGGGRGGAVREPPEKKFARTGLTGPVSDESDVSDADIAGLGDFDAVGTEDVPLGAPIVGGDPEEEPLNSGDDVSEAEEDVFDCPDILVCQYDKVNRAKAKWRFSFRDAILQCGAGRREYLFSRVTGEAEFS